MVAPVVVDQRHTVFGSVHIGIVRVVENHAVRNGLLGLLLGDIRFHIRQAHSHSQFERVGIFDPLFDVAVINIIRLAERLCRHLLVGMQGRNYGVQLLEHLHINGFLRIVSDRERLGRILDHLRIGNRAVSVRHAVHDRYAE